MYSFQGLFCPYFALGDGGFVAFPFSHASYLGGLPVSFGYSERFLRVSYEICPYLLCTAWWQKNSYPTKQKLIQKLIQGYEFFCHQAVTP